MIEEKVAEVFAGCSTAERRSSVVEALGEFRYDMGTADRRSAVVETLGEFRYG